MINLEEKIKMPKVCPHCRGKQMIPEKDPWGQFYSCLYCGYEHNPSVITEEELDDLGKKVGNHQPRHEGNKL